MLPGVEDPGAGVEGAFEAGCPEAGGDAAGEVASGVASGGFAGSGVDAEGPEGRGASWARAVADARNRVPRTKMTGTARVARALPSPARNGVTAVPGPMGPESRSKAGALQAEP